MLLELASIVAPIYLIAGLGWGWARAGRPFDTALVTDLIMMIGAPCLVFSSLVALDLERGALLSMAGATLAALVAFAAIGAAALWSMGLPLRTFLSPLVFVNSGNLGLPVCYFAFGAEGLAYAVCFYALVALAQFTLGQWVWSGETSPAVALRTPLAWAALAAAAVLAFDAQVPRWLLRTTGLLGDFAIPLMQLSLGVSLAQLRMSDLPRSAALAVLRLGMGVAVGIALAEWLQLEGVLRGVFVLDCAMPAAISNYMLAERYGRDARQVASVVVLSTLLAFASLPLLLAWLLRAA